MITQGQTTSFKVGLASGIFDFSATTGQTYKMALYTSAATLGPTTTGYTSSGEVVAAGYTAGGQNLVLGSPVVGANGVAYWSFNNLSWSAPSIVARGALIYLNNGGTNPSVAVLDFGSDKTPVAGIFTVRFPVTGPTSSVLRIA